MKDIMGLMKKAKEMQKQMQIAQGLVADIVVKGSSGSGLVTIELAGGGNMKTLKIHPSLFGSSEQDDVEMAEDLIVAAYQDAKIKLDEATSQTMKDTVGDIPLPDGMNLPL